ncbi:TPR-like protein [Fragilariopsis cylindrus CCMP1102]|uniref:TPR-like protein n=1 Tax=Fragilariopsis cylindrus CCMP1102 TaxID=635003 RepID=A0A1E7FT37_9STRA|nr:TPR-like protein [Fragilariopsis cylindrus CCMP1102]|eukprot:OEU21277.1 TPR-like protein [Fragilariopsis cylindrus CCMP1102]
MTWMGRGMLNLSANRLEQARFFFDTTLKECGKVLPALLGLAAVCYLENNYEAAQNMYAEAIRLYPSKSGASTRVGFGLACYRLGQVDRAKAAFARALDIDAENVEGMVGAAVLDMMNLDETSSHFNSQMEKAIKMMSMANLLDHSNAMVQNHLANHYFWKWTPIAGTIQKDYDRVIALAKGAYNSTSVQEIQAESLFFLARVYHVRGMMDDAGKVYDRSCKLNPNLTPARFGLAQVLIYQEQYDQAAAHLQLVLGTSSTATDALATLGLLEVKTERKSQEGLAHLRKAIDLDPLNPELILLEALALQQHESNFAKALERYNKAAELMKRQGIRIPFEIYTNIGVLSHETRKFDENSKKKSDLSVFVKRENSRMDDPHAISIAFNLARLHETSGRNLAAIELHKAILKRNPAYVNSYLRLACIAIDCGALNECAGWLKIAAETAPGNPEVLTLIGNLHLSLCDWAPAQNIFDGLLGKKIPNVEAYALLSMGNVYFANLDIPSRYAKHLGYAGDFYKRILTKDNANAYAANGLGTVIAEKAELFKAKEVFNRVREVTGDTISDTHLNLAHIYLAQKKHPEALQMYQSYLKRTEDGTSPITSKSRLDDKVDVLHYIAFAYFDWARQTELFNNAKAAPADDRYKKAMEHIELALAANCVLQKLTRNIRRTAQEVEEALNGLQHSLETVDTILKSKNEGGKVLISTSILNDFITHCKSNIESAKSHLEDERKREEEASEIRELQRMAAESNREEQKLQHELKKQDEAKKQEKQDQRAREKMRKVEDLQSGWEQEQAKAAAEKRTKKAPPPSEMIENNVPLEEDQEEAPPDATAGLFDDSDDSDEDVDEAKKTGVNDDEDKEIAANTTHQDLFGDSSDEDSDEELKPSSGTKRGGDDKEGDDEQPPTKKSKTEEDSE